MDSIEVQLIARIPLSEQCVRESDATHRSLHIIGVKCTATGTRSIVGAIIAEDKPSPPASMITSGARELDNGADQGGNSIDSGVRAAGGMGGLCDSWGLSLLPFSPLLLKFARNRDPWPFPEASRSCSFRRVSKATVR